MWWTLRNLVATVVLLCVGGAVLILGILAGQCHLGPEIVLPLLAIGGIVCLLMALSLVAIVFSKTGLADKTQALALPDGSVRAVIALGLVVIFAIVSVYLYGSLAEGGGKVQERTGLTYAQVVSLQNTAARADSKLEILNIDPPLPETPPTPQKPKKPNPPNLGSDLASDYMSPTTSALDTKLNTDFTEPSDSSSRYTVQYRYRMSQEASDFAKQLLILVGTLVTSVASFYFGSQAVQSAQAAMAGITDPSGDKPVISGIEPSSIDLTTSPDPVRVAISGSGLDKTSVKLVRTDGTSVAGSVVGAVAATAISCTFPRGSLAEASWALEVKNARGASDRRTFMITGRPPANVEQPGAPPKQPVPKQTTPEQAVPEQTAPEQPATEQPATE